MSRTPGDTKTTLLEKLLNKVTIDDQTDCWEFQGAKNNIGYGMIRDDKKMRTTHRVSYEEHNNVKIPSGLCVCHTCDNPSCVNPAHLWLGTRKQNTDDMIRKGRGLSWGGNTTHGRIHPRSGKAIPKTNCPHCSRDIANNLFARYHGDNCKLNPLA
jgi:hypothetical protein